MKAVFAFLLLASIGLAQNSPSASAQDSRGERRTALLIGNQKYAKLRPLPAVQQEMELMRAALNGAGFQVTSATDRDFDGLSKTMDAFVADTQPGDVCLFFYTGYAAQDGTDDFLLPVDFDPSSASLQTNAYPLTVLAKYLELKKAGLKIFFLEGARRIESPVSGAQQGLRKPVDTGDLTEYVLFLPTAINQYVQTAPDQVGLFTAALVDAIKRDGSLLTEMMLDVPDRVRTKSNGAQVPATDNNRLTKRFYFHAPKIEAPPPPPPPSISGPQSAQNQIDREEYTLIPAGTFSMGCVPSDTKCEKNEYPQHEITISKPFWMARNEVRVTSYMKYVSADPKARKKPTQVDWNKGWKLDSHPISNMTWEDAKAYCTWAGGRLPTEAEWEYAARGGKKDQIYPFDLDDSRNQANFYGQKGGVDIWDMTTAPVRSFSANEFGLFDMAGNVWEFVNDWYAPDYYSSSPKADPPGPSSGKQHVRRGGSFYSDAIKHLRISLREPSNRENNVGFRCVMDDTPESRRTLRIQ
jgi:formylglycine-generating enzyme required for sulfatase activity